MWEVELQAGGNQWTEAQKTSKLNQQALLQGQLQTLQYITVRMYMTQHLLSMANL